MAHSVGKYGMKVSQYFPSVGGATCTNPTTSTPATRTRPCTFCCSTWGRLRAV